MREGGRWGNSSVKAGGKEILRKVSSRWYNFTHGPYINYFCVHEAVYRQWIKVRLEESMLALSWGGVGWGSYQSSGISREYVLVGPQPRCTLAQPN